MTSCFTVCSIAIDILIHQILLQSGSNWIGNQASKMSEKPKVPAFKVGDDFYAWEKEVEVWQIVTALEETKQGAALYLALDGEAKDFCQGIPVADLKKDTGVQTVVDRIKELYGRDKDTIVYQALEDFETFQRGDRDINSFINEFDNRYFKVKTHCKMEYPNEALAYKLLKACNLSDEDSKLARATTSLDFKKMKDHLKTVFGNGALDSRGGGESSLPIKVENMYLNDECGPVLYGNASSSGRRNWVKRGGYSGSTNHYNGSNNRRNNHRRLNPFDSNGNRLRCHNCGAVTHFANGCPDIRGDPRNNEKLLYSQKVLGIST